MKQSITKWPAVERPREKLAQLGADHLSSSELIAILIATGTVKQSAVELARDLLNKFQTLENLSQASLQELQQLDGIGPAKAITLQASFQLSRNLQTEMAESRLIFFRNPADVASVFIPKLGHLKQEVFAIAMLDSAGKYIHSRELTRGTINASLIHPREVFRPAIKEAAASLILIHNHPSGQLSPSEEDLSVTQKLMETGEMVGIPVRDHLIIAGDKYLSLHEAGYLFK
jgi:DNA repair protein RadC